MIFVIIILFFLSLLFDALLVDWFFAALQNAGYGHGVTYGEAFWIALPLWIASAFVAVFRSS